MNRVSISLLLCLFCRLTKCFWGIRHHASVRAHEWIYIDGGEIMSETVNYVRNNSTCGLDLSKNWTNSSVILTCTERSAKALAPRSGALWFNEKQNSIYSFGGNMNSEDPSLVQTPIKSLWAFTLDGNGTGNWREVLGPTGPKPFPPGIFPGSPAAVASDESHGYYYGGFVRPGLIEGRSKGFLTVNFAGLTITNTTDGHSDYGQMVNVPYYGTSGVLILLGISSLDSPANAFKNITIYDKAKNKWYSQLTSGAIPSIRTYFCCAGIRGIGSDTFEIFMYGGSVSYPEIQNPSYPEIRHPDLVYILSIPAFQWFQAEYRPATSRTLHTCHTTNTNQLIIIGGIVPEEHPTSAHIPVEVVHRDPWAEAIGIFDMTTLKFKDSYEAKAKPYEPPEQIKNFYRDKSNRYPARWTSSAVQELFQIDSLKSDQVPNRNTTNSSSPPSPNLSSVAIAAIAIGGVLVGGGILCAIATISIRKIRKNHTKPSTIRQELAANESQELAANERPIEMQASINPPKLLDHHKDRTELE